MKTRIMLKYAGQVFFVIVLLLSLSPVQAAPAAVSKPQIIDDSSFINANNILMMVTNLGFFGRDPGGFFGYDYGTFYPYSSIANIRNGTQIKSPLYSGGFWIGGKVAGQARVTVSDFASEYWPGPIRNGTFIANAVILNNYRTYKLYSDSGQGNPNSDYLQWPISDGAPTDAQGQPLILGQQTLWSVYNDANPGTHTLIASQSAPLGVEVRQTTWAYSESSRSKIIYMEFRLFNKGENNITEAYISVYMDPDLGNAEDDLTGCDTVSHIMYCYNANNNDLVYGTQPPAIGVKMEFGPAVDSPGDSALFFGKIIRDHKNLPMSAFISYPNGDDPQNTAESYNIQRGFHRNGTPLTNGTRFSYPGDPVAGSGDLQTVAGNPHFIGSFGPFDFPAGDSQYVLVKLGIGQGTDRLSSITNLKYVLNLPDTFAADIKSGPAASLPSDYYLGQNVPNPFNSQTQIAFDVPEISNVSLAVFNLLGQRVATIIEGDWLKGNHTVNWNGTDLYGRALPSGIYFYRFTAGDYTATRKLLLLR